jgi:uncharacterized membrane-anchored protein YhcB (DUF1043 family)
MERFFTALTDNSRLTRRQLMALGALGLASWMFSLVRTAEAALQEDLELISNLPRMADREGPLLVFRDFVADSDVEVEQHIRLQLSQRKELLAALKQRIGFEKQVRLSVEETQVRLMFVPQLQNGAAAAYHRYCLAVTDFLFEMGGQENIYAAITSPTKGYPPLSDTGISAFLVHRLAKDYQAVCRFTAESGRSVKYKASGTIFSNHMGAVDLQIEVLAPERFGLTRSPFTIWQNNSNGIATLMAVPVEETLHYCLGEATDRQIAEAMRQDPPKSLAAARLLAEEWMAIEESVVGGLVERVLERYCAKYQMNIQVSVEEEMRAAISSLDQYRYRERGIRLVQHLGFRKALAMYMENPASFRDQLFRPEEA